ncbi:Fic family protein [Gardnerella piotii]|uniref:Fic family protein n=1 Tax=Gardnerella piotii TaxID=2792977 RepID=A0ABU5MP57_9BIFI|nr:Fic family protein [Gardnerella piotii]MDZ7544198.1 Fic family protein [Gardnerella piotii]MDZ7552435.1 Fic family protein [Gardnerella piotii]
MAAKYEDVQELLRKKADLNARLSLLAYDGTPEIKNRGDGKYLYTRKRVSGKLTSTYVGVYSDDLYNLLLRNASESRQLRKELRAVVRQLANAGYSNSELSADLVNNIAFARANLKSNIYDQAVLEGVATTFPQTEEIIDNGKVFGVSASDVQKILNLKHAWEFILDEDVLLSRSDYYMLSHIAKLVNEGFFLDGGRIRGVPVAIGGSTYIPPIPNEIDVKEKIRNIVEGEKDSENVEDKEVSENIEDKVGGKEPIDIAIELCVYCMKSQIFLDGNKRASVIFANHYLISHGNGLLVIPENRVPEFKKLLVEYYEGEDSQVIASFMREYCWKH